MTASYHSIVAVLVVILSLVSVCNASYGVCRRITQNAGNETHQCPNKWFFNGFLGIETESKAKCVSLGPMGSLCAEVYVNSTTHTPYISLSMNEESFYENEIQESFCLKAGFLLRRFGDLIQWILPNGIAKLLNRFRNFFSTKNWKWMDKKVLCLYIKTTTIDSYSYKSCVSGEWKAAFRKSFQFGCWEYSFDGQDLS